MHIHNIYIFVTRPVKLLLLFKYEYEIVMSFKIIIYIYYSSN